MYNKQNRQLTF